MDSNADGRVEMDEFIRCCLEVELMSTFTIENFAIVFPIEYFQIYSVQKHPLFSILIIKCKPQDSRLIDLLTPSPERWIGEELINLKLTKNKLAIEDNFFVVILALVLDQTQQIRVRHMHHVF